MTREELVPDIVCMCAFERGNGSLHLLHLAGTFLDVCVCVCWVFTSILCPLLSVCSEFEANVLGVGVGSVTSLLATLFIPFDYKHFCCIFWTWLDIFSQPPPFPFLLD